MKMIDFNGFHEPDEQDEPDEPDETDEPGSDLGNMMASSLKFEVFHGMRMNHFKLGAIRRI